VGARTMLARCIPVKVHVPLMNDTLPPRARTPLPADLARLLETLAKAVEYRVGETRDDQLANYCASIGYQGIPRQSQTLLAAFIRVIARHAAPGGEMLRGTYADMLCYLDYLGDTAPRFRKKATEEGQDQAIAIPYDRKLIRLGITDIAGFAGAPKARADGRIPFPGGWWRLHALNASKGAGVAQITVALWDTTGQELLSENIPAQWVPLPQAEAIATDLESSAWVQTEPSGAEPAPPKKELSIEERARRRVQELPIPATDFVGRSKQITEISDALQRTGTVPVVAISGMPGIGKSELAITIARGPLLADRFPHYVVFYQFPRATEVKQLPTPRDVMEHCLRSLKITTNATESVEARFQQVLATVSVLIVLDNLPDGWPLADIRPPAPTGILITARSRVDYPGIVSIHLRPLSLKRGRELVIGAVPRVAVPVPAGVRGRLTTSNADAAAELAAKDTDLAGLIAILCGGLPLAIRAASGVLANLPDMDAETYVTRLMRETERLKSLKSPGGGPYSVEAAFRVSYELLNSNEQMTFRRVGYFSGTVEKERAAQSLGALVRECLPELVRRNLVESQHSSSYRMHDLMRLFARQMMTDDDRRGVERRLLEYWLANASAHYDEQLRSFGQTEWHPNGIRVKLEPTEDDLANAILAVSGKRDERCVPMLTLKGLSRFGKSWAEKGIEASRRLGNHVAEALHHFKRGQQAERQGLIADRTKVPGLRASRITHPAARSALAHYADGMKALRGCRDGDAWLVLLSLLRHYRRMHIVLCDQEMVIKVSRMILTLPLRLPKWETFAAFQAIADAFFNRGDLPQSELYAHRALNVADLDELDNLRVHPLNLLGDIELLRGHRGNALAAYREAEKAGAILDGSEQLGHYWSPGWNLSHELQDRSKVYTFHESYLMRTLLLTPVRKWPEVLAEHLPWYGYAETWPHNSRFNLRVAHAYLVIGDTKKAVHWLSRAVEAGGDFWSFAAMAYLPRTWARGDRSLSPKQRAATIRVAESIVGLIKDDQSPLVIRAASALEMLSKSETGAAASAPDDALSTVTRA
jgi:hypothetical protein